jgi:hypothetical protein
MDRVALTLGRDGGSAGGVDREADPSRNGVENGGWLAGMSRNLAP